MTVTLNSLWGKLSLFHWGGYFLVGFFLVLSFWTYSSASFFCLTFSVWLSELDETTISHNREKVVLCRNDLYVDCVCQLVLAGQLEPHRAVLCLGCLGGWLLRAAEDTGWGSLEHGVSGHSGGSAFWDYNGRNSLMCMFGGALMVLLSGARTGSGWCCMEHAMAALQVGQSSWTELQPELFRWRKKHKQWYSVELSISESSHSSQRAPVVFQSSLSGSSYFLCRS